MPKIVPISPLQARPPDAFPDSNSEKIADTVRTLLSLLPAVDRHRLLDELVKAERTISAPRAGEVLGTIVQFLPKRQTWTAEEIRDEVAAAGVEASSRDVFNAIGYLARKGHIQRVGYGQYRVDGTVVSSAADLGGGTVRNSEHYD
jgi:hypothetical protein